MKLEDGWQVSLEYRLPDNLYACIGLQTVWAMRLPSITRTNTAGSTWGRGSSKQMQDPSGPMADKAQNLQDAFLNQVRKQKIPLTIFLVNGVKLNGVVSWFDNFCVLLKRDGIGQLVYKHAISTIMPATPVNLGPDSDSGDDH